MSLATDFVKTEQKAVDGFLKFVNASPSCFHAVKTVRERLEANGYVRISETEADAFENIKPNGKYYFTRNQSTLFAFAVGGKYEQGNGFSVIAAHTDSPCLKVKPISAKTNQGFEQVGVETYGGGLWNTWFDRDLSVAGRVVINNGDGKFSSKLVKVDRPILRVPNLAIHLNREIYDKGFKYNKETHLSPILSTSIKSQLACPDADKSGKHQPLLLKIIAKELDVKVDQIEDFELSLFDTQDACVGGALNEFIYSARLDNLMMSYCSIEALLASDETLADDTNVRLVSLFDNEEIGSSSDRGAFSRLMVSTFERIAGKHYNVAIRKSFLISADMAHAIHPNYAEKHEENHKPKMHAGIVIKHNANQRYATTSITAFMLREIGKRHGIPIQDFVVRQDSACGSTVGPMLSANTGIRTVDVGAPQLSMHSIREMCATEDVHHSIELFRHFFAEFPALDSNIDTEE